MSVWFEQSGEEPKSGSHAHVPGLLTVPLEILERILQLTPASQHHALRRVCKSWQDVINQPIMKREVVVNADAFEIAWHRHFKSIFTTNIRTRPEPAAEAYGHILALWIGRFVGRHTRTLIMTHELCNKAHLLWPSLRLLLQHKCPRLRKLVFQCGRVRLEVLTHMLDTVAIVQLEYCQIVKRHWEEGFTECLVLPQNHPNITLDYRALFQKDIEPYLRSITAKSKD